MKAISQIGIMVFLITVFYVGAPWFVEEFLANFMNFMFADYVAFYTFYIVPILPGWSHPVVLILIAAIVAVIFPSLLRLSRVITSFIVALFLVQITFSLVGAPGVPAPSTPLMLFASFAFGWLLVAAALGDRGIWRFLGGNS